MQQSTFLQEAMKLALDAGLKRDEIHRIVDAELLHQALQRVKGNQRHAADALGVHRNTVSRELGTLGLLELPAKIREANKQPKLPFMGKRPEGIWVDPPKRRMA